VISTIADTVLLVALSRKVQIENIKRTKEYLLKVKANIAGVILNKIEIHNNYSNYYYKNYNDGPVKKNRKKPANFINNERTEFS